MLKLKNSGYSETFRRDIIASAKDAYLKQCNEMGVKPLYRNRDQMEKDRLKKKSINFKWWNKGSIN